MPNFQPAPASRPTAIANERTNSMHTQSVVNRYRKTRLHRVVPRPLAVKAIADVFIQSLVLAGFCSDHAPRKQLSPVHHTANTNRLSPLASPPIYKKNNSSIKKSRFGLRQFTFASHFPHWRSLNTHAAKKDPDDQYYDISDDSDDRYYDISDDSASIDTSNERINANSIGRTNLVRRRWSLAQSKEYQTKVIRLGVNKSSNTSIIGMKSQDDAQRKMYQARVSRPRVNKSSNWTIIRRRWRNYALPRDLRLFLGALHDRSKSNQYIFSLYKRLPSPGVKILASRERRILLYRFSRPEDRRGFNARYYLSLFDDMVQSGFHISVPMCRDAIYSIANRVPVLEERDLQDAITVWQRMEKVYGMKADNVIFELLFMIASKAGRYTVADRFLSEMTSRGLHLTRYGHMNVMWSYGRRRDVQALHQQFESYVHSGQLVDTGVINCLISSYINSGDSSTADQLYSRMMDEHRKTIETAVPDRRNYMFSPSLSSDFGIWNLDTKMLNTMIDTYLDERNELVDEEEKEEKKPLQDVVCITPNTRTFHILFHHHCLRTGDMNAVSRLLLDMEDVFDVPPRAFIYYFLFRGFAIHSSDKGWTEDGLREVWRAFKRTLYESYARMSRESLLPRWENPLRSICEATVESSHDHAEKQREEHQSQGGETQDSRAAKSQSRKDSVSEGENLMELFDKMQQLGKYNIHWRPRKDLSRRIENGVFLSRELNVVILKAFGAHGGSDTLLRVFSDIERMWKPWKRLGSDVRGVKKELQRQLTKVQDRERQLSLERVSKA